MVSKAHRFHGHNALRVVYQKGKAARGPFMSLKYIQNPRRKRYRAAVVVSKKVHKSAVVRNRIRRRVYELVRLHVPAATNYDFVFLVYQADAAELPAAKLEKAFAKLLAGAGISSRVPYATLEPKERR